MAPTNDRARWRGGGGTGRPHRYASTNAGVNRGQFRAAPRAGDTPCRHIRDRRGRPRTTVPAHASLVSRMTYGNHRGHGHGHGYGSLARGGAPRPHRQQARPLQDRITRPGDGHIRSFTTGVNTIPYAPTGPRPQPILHTTATTNVPNASITDDVDINIESDMELDDFDFFTPRPPIDDNTSSSLFVSSQPTQATQLAGRPQPVPPTNIAPPPIRIFNSPFRARACSRTTNPAAINNDSDADDESPTAPKRPANTYRGTDPIKRLVSNPKLRAVLADKPVPGAKEVKTPREARMGLRLAMGRVMK